MPGYFQSFYQVKLRAVRGKGCEGSTMRFSPLLPPVHRSFSVGGFSPSFFPVVAPLFPSSNRIDFYLFIL